MVPASSPSTAVDSADDERDFGIVASALVGALVTVVLSFVPLSTVVGGAAAGYLRGGDANDGMKAGALAGLVALVPFTAAGFVLLFFLGYGFVASGLALGVAAVVVLLVGVVYTVVLSVVGGYLGAYAGDEL